MMKMNKVGDKVIISSETCKCGRSSRIIESIEGRTGDQILTENGELLSQYLFYYAVKDLDKIGLENSILQYKVIQNKNNFELFIIKGPNYSDAAIEYIKQRMFEKIGGNINIKIKFTEELPKDKSGKLRFFERKS